MSKEHPLAKTAKQLTTDDLIGWPHIIADCENEALLQATYPYLHGDTSTPIVRVEDQGIGLATMLLGFGVEAVPEEVFPSLQDGYVVRHVIGYQATLETGWAYLANNQNPALIEVHRLRQCAPLITFIVMSCSYKRLLSPNQKPIFHKNITST